MWLAEKLLLHAVLQRTSKPVKQLKKGLRDSGVWDLLSARPDTAVILFPRTAETIITPQLMLDKITWPTEVEDDVPPEDHYRIVGFLRQFIENGTPDVLKCLLRFWTGWEVLPGHLEVEVINCALPQSSTCFNTLKLPAHLGEFELFTNALQAIRPSTGQGIQQSKEYKSMPLC